MRIKGTKKYMLAVSILLLALTTCKKEDNAEELRLAKINTLIGDISADSIKNHVEWLENMGSRFCFSDNHLEVAEKIRKKFVAMGYPDAVLDPFIAVKTFRNVMYEQTQYKVIATLEGTDHPDSACVVGAHYDNILSTSDLTIVPGANDNASGTAAVLEIARVMKLNNYKPQSTIVFIAFAAEEIGLYGSKNFAGNPNEFGGKIRFMLNSDMIAYETSSSSSNWQINIMDYSNSGALRHEAEKMCTDHTLLGYFTNNSNNTRSDSYPFYTNGYKALFFFSGDSDPNYHSLNDVSENCNFPYCAEVVKLQCALLAYKN
ncbi:MAG: M20/M25/M40 family metallo-hydrolase [Bacteroidales bacterium]|nr:M20/M25/M40 family metallo-hydrolase [Bacteroidales bacterium]